MNLAEMALAALRVCPQCAGGSRVPYNGDWADPDAEMVDCDRCDGYGDLLGAVEARCYVAGRQDALDEAQRLMRYGAEALAQPFPPGLTRRGLQLRVGTTAAGGLRP